MKQSLKIFLRCIAFLLITIIIFAGVNQALNRKAISGAWNMTIKTNGFYNEPKNHFEVMGFGSSHMYCTFNPISLWEKSGIPSYILTSQQQPPCTTYYYIKEALKTQTPKVVVVETYMFTLPPMEYNEGVYHDAIDYLKFSKNKIDFINEMVPKTERKNYLIPFLKYHSRWENLTAQDFNLDYLSQTDQYKGYVYLTKSTPQKFDLSVRNIQTKSPIHEQNLYYLNKIVELSKQYHFKLLFIASPYNVTKEEQKVFNSIKEFAKANHIDYIDFNLLLEQINLNMETDFYDSGHTNILGSNKVMNYLASYLQSNYNLQDFSSSAEYHSFNECLQLFKKQNE